MKNFVENILLFYAALPDHDNWILSRAREMLDRKADSEYLDAAAEAYGAAAGLIALLTAAGRRESISDTLRCAAEREASVTVSMRSLSEEIGALLEREGIPFIPLKGCDRRIVELARVHSNPMRDVDILVRPDDIPEAGKLLVRNGYLHLGSFSGAHMNFATDEDLPRFIEIHWDLVNRSSPVQRRLFLPDLEKIWERSTVLCGTLHLSPEDLVCYTAAHAAKEYFRRPKWIADMAGILDNSLAEVNPFLFREVIREWGVSTVLGIIGKALASVLPERKYEALYAAGARCPGILGRYIADNLFGYSRLYSIRPLCSLAFAPSLAASFAVAAGIGERVIMGRGK
jgi:hypothetical protein